MSVAAAQPPAPSRWRQVAAALLAAALVSCGGSSGRARTVPSSPEAVRADQQLIGRWALADLQVLRDGQLVSRQAHGELSYDEFANINVHVELLPAEPDVTPPRVVLLDFVAKASPDRGRGELVYVGLQPRARDRLLPDAIDASEWRHFELQGDTFRLSVEDGGRVVATLTWRRVGR